MSDPVKTYLLRRMIPLGIFFVAAWGWNFKQARDAKAAAAQKTAPVAAQPVASKNPLKKLVDNAKADNSLPAEAEVAGPSKVTPVPLPPPPPGTPSLAEATPPPASPAPATPVAAPIAGPVQPPEFSTGEKPNLLLAKRTERRFAKLREWAAKLEAKKATLKTPLQIEAFNEEAAKYHAELVEARQEAATLAQQ